MLELLPLFPSTFLLPSFLLVNAPLPGIKVDTRQPPLVAAATAHGNFDTTRLVDRFQIMEMGELKFIHVRSYLWLSFSSI